MKWTRRKVESDSERRQTLTAEDMDCFDPFKDYLELSFSRSGRLESEESPLIERMQGSIDDIGWLNGRRPGDDWKPLNGVPGQWTPGSSSSESSGARPLLGRRDSTDEPLPQHNNHEQQLPRTSTVPGGSGSDSTAEVMSDARDGAWGHGNGAWTDMSSEINSGQMASWNGNHLNLPSSNGLHSTGSTGFFADDNNSESTSGVGRCTSRWLNEGLNPTTAYPSYSVGLNVEYPETMNHVAILLNKLMQQTNAGNTQRNAFRSFNSLDEGKYCAFCKKNGERREFYTTHVVKDSWGKVICPILRKYVCPNCGATGDNAHTLRHCPVRANENLNL